MTTYTFTKQHTLGTIGNFHITWERATYILGALVVVFVVMYMALLASTTVNISMRKTLQQEIRETQGVIADLESIYLTQRELLTIEEAYARGFVDAPQNTFAYRYDTAPSVALSGTRVR